MFAAPDGTAFVQLSWLWDCRYACFTTVLADGADVPAHTRLEDFARLWTAESDVRSRWTARTRWVVWGLLFVVFLTASTVVGVLVGAQP